MKMRFFLATIFLCSCVNNSGTKISNESISQLNEIIDNLDASLGWGGIDGGNDFSSERFSEGYKQVQEQLTNLQLIDTSLLTFDEKIDWEFAQSLISGRVLNQGKMKFWQKDPREYMAFRRIGNTIEGPGSRESKLEKLSKSLTLVPAQLNNGMKQLEVYVPRFQELGLFMAENSKILFKEEIPAFIKSEESEENDKLITLCNSALESLEVFINFLKTDLPNKPAGDFAIGEETYEAMLKDQFLLDFNAEELYNFGWEQFKKTQSELEELAKKINPSKTWQELIIEIKNDYPQPDSMIQAHQYWVDKSREHMLSNDLIPIPWKEKVTVVPRAEYLRKTSYYGNFSSAKEADKDGIFQSEWMINPFEDQWDEETKQQYMVEHDWGVIIVTAPHETYGGHHVQGLYQLDNPRKLRRENGISLFSEGWGLYNEQLMQETNFFPNERIHLRQLQLRLWRNARVIYDVGLHTKRLTYEEAIELMVKEVGFLRWAGQLEIDSATSRPGYFIGYFLGMHEILAMREEYKKKMGEEFSLKDFHVKLLEIGNMPTSLMRKSLMH